MKRLKERWLTIPLVDRYLIEVVKVQVVERYDVEGNERGKAAPVHPNPKPIASISCLPWLMGDIYLKKKTINPNLFYKTFFIFIPRFNCCNFTYFLIYENSHKVIDKVNVT